MIRVKTGKSTNKQIKTCRTVFSPERLEELDRINLSVSLDIWEHIYNNKKATKLKSIIEEKISVLFDDFKELVNTLTVENIFMEDNKIRAFDNFLKKIRSPKANEFVQYRNKTKALLSQYFQKQGKEYTYKIPVEEILTKLDDEKCLERKFVCFTHENKISVNGINIEFVSRLAKEPEAHPLLDKVSTNIPTNDYFTITHQQNLNVLCGIESSVFLGMLSNPTRFKEYKDLLYCSDAKSFKTWFSFRF